MITITIKCDHKSANPNEPLTCPARQNIEFFRHDETYGDMLQSLAAIGWLVAIDPISSMPSSFLCPHHTPRPEPLPSPMPPPTKPSLPSIVMKGQQPDDPRHAEYTLIIGDFAGVRLSGSYGRIHSIKRNFDHRGDLYRMRYYDSDTGLPMPCPDSRCANYGTTSWPPPDAGGCVICSIAGDRARFSKYTKHDVAYFRQEGMINGD